MGETEGQERSHIKMSERAFGRKKKGYADVFSHLHGAMCILVQC